MAKRRRSAHHALACRRRRRFKNNNNGNIKEEARLSSRNLNFGNINENHRLVRAGLRPPRPRFDDKAQEEEEEEERRDRLSVLPDDIIHHIFSYLETLMAVRTSVLSRRWRHVWTTCPHLYFHSLRLSYGPRPLSLDKFVTNVLSHRNHDSPLQKVEAHFYTSIPCTNATRASLLDYAISHNVIHLALCFEHGIHLPQQQLSACKSLKTLDLQQFSFSRDQPPLHSLSLTTLRLSCCSFIGNSDCINPFDACPNLSHLSLKVCSFLEVMSVKISAPRLLELNIQHLLALEVFNVDVDAPNLKTFIYAHTPRPNFSSVNFPNLEYADITYLRHGDKKKEDCLRLFRLLQCLHNAQFLVLDPHHDSGVVAALSMVATVLENQSSPFNRLKVLKLNRPHIYISSKVMSYLCNASPHAEIKLLELPKNSSGSLLIEVMADQLKF